MPLWLVDMDVYIIYTHSKFGYIVVSDAHGKWYDT